MIREAKLNDRWAVIEMMKRFAKHAKAPERFNPAHFSIHLVNWIALEDHLVLVEEQDRCLVAMLMASISPSPFAPVNMAEERAFWVEESWRGKADVFGMIAAFESWAVDRGAAYGVMSALSQSRADTLFRRRGYRTIENRMIKAL